MEDKHFKPPRCGHSRFRCCKENVKMLYRFCIRQSRHFKEMSKLRTLLILLPLLLLQLAYLRSNEVDWKAHLRNEAQEAQFQLVLETAVTTNLTQSGSQHLLRGIKNLADVAVPDKVRELRRIKHRHNRDRLLYEGSERKSGTEMEHLRAGKRIVHFSRSQNQIEKGRSERSREVTEETRSVALPLKPRNQESNSVANIDPTQEFIHGFQPYPKQGFDSQLFAKREPQIRGHSQPTHNAKEQTIDDLELYKKIVTENQELSQDKIKMAERKAPLNNLAHINDTTVEEISITDIFAKRVSQRTNDTNEPGEIPECLFPPFGLLGPIPVDRTPVKIGDVEASHPELSPGGHWQPSACWPKHRVAIIIPFRDRQAHLTVLLRHLHPILQRQLLHYSIIAVDQADSRPFNRGQLLNIGALEALKMGPVDCFVFHDVDHLPENDNILYNCPAQPLHMSAAVEKFKYSVPYATMFGGVSALTVDHFFKANGFNNRFWGWGGEDDDMYNRIYGVGLHVTRYSPDVARYSTLRHAQAESAPSRAELVIFARRQFASDGLNSLHYKVLGVSRKRLYTRLAVETMDTEGTENAAAKLTPVTLKKEYVRR